MARLPGEQDFSGIPSARSGRIIAREDTSPLFEGAAAFGRGLDAFGRSVFETAANVQQRRQELDTYDVERRFQEFRFNEGQRFIEAERSIEAGQAEGFADGYSASYRERARGFMATVPEHLRPQFDQRLFAVEREFYAAGYEFEGAEQTRYALNGMHDTLDNEVVPRALSLALSLPPNPTFEQEQAAQVALDEIIADGYALIDANPELTGPQKDEQRRAFEQRVQRAFAEQLPAEELGAWLGTDVGSLAHRIIMVEGGYEAGDNYNPDESSAFGVGQFTDSTWLEYHRRAFPEYYAGLSEDEIRARRSEILALRSNPQIGFRVTEELIEGNRASLTAAGIQATDANLYLAHFLGAQGAIDALAHGAATPIEAAIRYDQWSANRELWENANIDTVGDLVAWAQRKMRDAPAGQSVPILDAIPYEDRVALTADAQTRMAQQANDRAALETAQYQAQLNDLLVGINDGILGEADLLTARNSWLNDYDDIVKVQNALEDRYGAIDNTAAAWARFTGDDEFSRYSSDDRRDANLVYESNPAHQDLLLAADDEETTARHAAAVSWARYNLERTTILPEAATAELLRGMNSNDPVTLQTAATVLDGLYRLDPEAVRRAIGEDGLDRLHQWKGAIRYNSPERVAELMDPYRDPGEQQRFDALAGEGRGLVETRDIQVALNTFHGAFNAPNIGEMVADPQRAAAFERDYIEIFGEKYAWTRNEELAHQQTIEAMAQVWGQTRVGTQNRVVAYPPEHYYPALGSEHRWMQDDLRAFVREHFGEGVRDFGVSADTTTDATLGADEGPTYRVWAFMDDGRIEFARGDDGQIWPFRFDVDTYRARDAADFMEERAIDAAEEVVEDAVIGAVVTPEEEVAPTDAYPLPPFMRIPLEENTPDEAWRALATIRPSILEWLDERENAGTGLTGGDMFRFYHTLGEFYGLSSEDIATFIGVPAHRTGGDF